MFLKNVFQIRGSDPVSVIVSFMIRGSSFILNSLLSESLWETSFMNWPHSALTDFSAREWEEDVQHQNTPHTSLSLIHFWLGADVSGQLAYIYCMSKAILMSLWACWMWPSLDSGLLWAASRHACVWACLLRSSTHCSSPHVVALMKFLVHKNALGQQLKL